MSQFGNKTTPWARSNPSPNMVNQNNAALQTQMMNQNLSNLNNSGLNSGLVQFQQQQVFQNTMLPQQNIGLGLQQMGGISNPIFQQVSYPNPRGLNPTAFQTQNISSVPPVQNNSGPGTKQRFFTGTVTKVHDNFGFVDEDVFFQTNACVKGSNPMVGDRVLVEATYNPSMPFKWNATRIQVLPTTNAPNRNAKNYSNSNYNAVPPPNDNCNGNFGRNRSKAMLGRGRERSRERDREDEEVERKKRREERLREREKEEKKSPIRRRSRSPKSRRRSRIVPRYMVQIPKIALDMPRADVLEVRRRYANIYIPSDFFFSNFRWVDAFPPDKPFTLNKPSSFHIMNKDIEPLVKNEAVLEPPDADYLFSAKVMLMSVPGVEELYQKCCAMAEDKDRRERDSEERDYVHPTRLVNFLVGLRGKNETMAIGGPWSPSADGEHPDRDPAVLIRTAIRTCKALTGIDLSSCTQWYRFLELYYRRGESTHRGRAMPARVETVVLYLPDVWSCLPTRLEWDALHHRHRTELERRLAAAAAVQAVVAAAQPVERTSSSEAAAAAATHQSEEETAATAALADEKDEDTGAVKPEPTHYSQLDPRTMAVHDLRKELKARNINSKGLKSQMVARLQKALKAEMERGEDDNPDDGSVKGEEESEGMDVAQDEKKLEIEEKKLDEKEKALLEKRYTLPEQPHIIVYPSKSAKSGKFDCTTMSLSLLLDYRPEDTKEHSFEVSLFAELFNEMLMRDFGFNIFRALHDLPDKTKEKEEKKKKDDNKKKDKEEKKDEDKEKKTEEEPKKDDEKKRDAKKDDKRTDESEDEDEEEDDKKKDKRKKERVKLYTKDKHLLLSFVYFDQTHCGYIFDKDIEDLLYTLGLNLSRAQVRKLVGKVVTRDSLHYRKLTDKPWDEESVTVTDSEKEANHLRCLATGNKKLLPVFNADDHVEKKPKLEDSEEQTKSIDDGMVMFRGALMDVGKLLQQLERSEKARLETESRMVDLKNENTKLSDKFTKSNSTIKHLNTELKDCKEKLRNVEDSLTKVNANSKLYHNMLCDIRDKIDPILKGSKDELVVKKEEKDKKHEDNKSRWEKDTPKEDGNDESVEVKKEK